LQKVFSVGDREKAFRLFGPHERFLKLLRDEFDVTVVARAGEVCIEGVAQEVRSSERLLKWMEGRIEAGEAITESGLQDMIRMEKLERNGSSDSRLKDARIEGLRRGTATVPRTVGQAEYVRTMQKNDLVFCIGPAGTGKTYLAVAMALYYLKTGEVERIVLCRPAVEAGEHLGFLPGDMRAKVNPYLRPLYDALHHMMDVEQVRRYIEKDIIEILPLAFVRGRTLDDAFIILDEAQNCSIGQMKTFLTRLGVRSRLVVTGDITQIDLPKGQTSGLVDVQERLTNIPGIAMARLTEADIVRHRLVKNIVEAYQKETRTVSEPEVDGEGSKDAAQQ